jgi:hypothetical protein
MVFVIYVASLSPHVDHANFSFGGEYGKKNSEKVPPAGGRDGCYLFCTAGSTRYVIIPKGLVVESLDSILLLLLYKVVKASSKSIQS